MTEIYHALGLHMHQPPGNLAFLINQEAWEAKQIMLCYERPLKYLEQYADVARLHIGFSGVLLEQLKDPMVKDRYASIVNISRMICRYSHIPNIELIGTGYYHPIFPLIPSDDWAEQLARGRNMMAATFGLEPKGFWPSEMGFCMEMIPYLKNAGYEYILVDSMHIAPLEGPSDKCTPFQPYLAEYDGYQICVVPRNRNISNAQEGGMDAGWFEKEVKNKVSGCPSPCLVTTWSDGENGGWFRQTHEPSGFWGHYFAPYMEWVRNGLALRPVLLSEYLKEHPPTQRAYVSTGAWNVGSTSGYDFSQWAGTEKQKRALDEIFQISRWYHHLKAELNREVLEEERAEAEKILEKAYRYILQSETSCYLFWGDAWVDRVYEVTRKARNLLKELLCVLP
jgi:alpha-amylase/alpha-mannosidase (GH57 family)